MLANASPKLVSHNMTLTAPGRSDRGAARIRQLDGDVVACVREAGDSRAQRRLKMSFLSFKPLS